MMWLLAVERELRICDGFFPQSRKSRLEMTKDDNNLLHCPRIKFSRQL